MRLREAKKIAVCQKAIKRKHGIWEPRLSDSKAPGT